MSRLPPFDAAGLSSSQRRIYDTIMSGPRGKFGGPFPALLECPDIANQVQALGGALRFSGSLPTVLREAAILVVARHWRSAVEWDAHVTIALREGVECSIITAILNEQPVDDASADVRSVVMLSRELNETKQISDATYQQAVSEIGLEGVVELTVLLGYFALLSMVLNTFEVAPSPADGVPPSELRLPE